MPQQQSSSSRWQLKLPRFRNKRNDPSVSEGQAAIQTEQTTTNTDHADKDSIIRDALDIALSLESFPTLVASIRQLSKLLEHSDSVTKPQLAWISRLCGSLKNKVELDLDDKRRVALESRLTEIESYEPADRVDQMIQALLAHRISLEHDMQKHQFKAEKNNGDRRRLSQLLLGRDVGFLSYPNCSRCLPGTGKELLRDLLVWAMDAGTSDVCYLQGVVGSGKSTVAMTLADELVAFDCFGASFFYSSYSAVYNDLQNVFPILAYQLATSAHNASRTFRAELLSTLEWNSDLTSLTESEQLQKLIIQPMQKVGVKAVIIIDGIDQHKDGKAIHTTISSLSTSPCPCKFLLTGRSGFHAEGSSLTKDMQAYYTADIQKFLKAELASVPAPKPPGPDLLSIAARAAGSFSRALIELRFTLKYDKAVECLIDDQSQDTSETGIDGLYSAVLQKARASLASDEDFRRKFQPLLSLIAVAREPLSSNTIEDLLPDDEAESSLAALDLVLNVSKDKSQIVIFPEPFRNYLTSRCTFPKALVNSDDHDRLVATRCFQVLSRSLKRNICSLQRYALNSDLTVTQRSRLSEATIYCCRYWPDHLLPPDGEEITSEIKSLLDVFLSQQQLLWFEVLGLLGELDHASNSLARLKEWLNDTTPYGYDEILKHVSEGMRLLSSSSDAIEKSVRHIYHSVLPFSPWPWFALQPQSGDDEHEAKVVIGRDLSLPQKTIPVPDWVRSLQYSNDGSKLAAGGDGFCFLFDTTAKSLTKELYPYSSFMVEYVACCDFKVAAAHGSTITVWNTDTGASIAELHQDEVASISFHPSDPNSLLVGSSIGTAYLWDIEHRTRATIIELAESNGVTCWHHDSSAAGQPNIVVGLTSGNLVLMAKGEGAAYHPYKTFSSSQDGSVNIVASNPDGTFIASGSVDGTVTVYRVDSNSPHIRTKYSRMIRSLQFSPRPDDSTLVFTSGFNVYVCNIDPTTANNFATVIYEHADDVRYAVISPDGCYMATGADDNQVKIWKMERHHWRRMTCVGISNDGSYFVTGSEDKTVRVWNAKSLQVEILRGHQATIDDVLVLPGDSHIVSIDRENNVFLWARQQWGRFTQLSNSVVPYAALSTFNERYHHGRQGFFCCPSAEWGTVSILCLTLHKDKLVLAARGSSLLLEGERVTSIDHVKAPHSPDITLILSCKSGRRLRAQWPGAVSEAGPPSVPTSLTWFLDNQHQHPIEPKLGHNIDVDCSISQDDQWILNSDNQKILWLPPACRGWGVWDQKRLVLVGYHGKFTVVDFENVEVTLDHIPNNFSAGQSRTDEIGREEAGAAKVEAGEAQEASN